MSIVIVHIIAGLTAIVAGAVALSVTKGGALHRKSGMVFVGAMTVLSCAVIIGCGSGTAPNLGGGSMAERLARMPSRPAKPCDEPTYLIPGLPLSMATMNMLFASTLGTGLMVVALRRWSPR